MITITFNQLYILVHCIAVFVMFGLIIRELWRINK